MELSKIISQLGILVKLDSRDNIFTPFKGVKLHEDGNRADKMLGSDYEFRRLSY